MTIAESVQNAANRLDAATAAMTSLRDGLALQVSSVIADARAAAFEVINRPGMRVLYVDPVDGSEDNPGTLAKPRKNLDAVIAGTGLQFTLVYLLNDAVVQMRHEIFATFIIYGIQRAANAVGFTTTDRQISFLGRAVNSPRSTGEVDCAGITLYGYNFQSGSISYRLPELPGGLTLKSHINSNTGATVTIVGANVSTSGSAAGALVGSLNQKMPVYFSGVIGAGAAGHMFEGVAAGANPNNLFSYTTNVTSA